MKNLKEYNKMFEGHRTMIDLECNNGRTYFLYKIDEENDWLFSFTSKKTEWLYDEEKRMVYNDVNKFLKAVKRILKNQKQNGLER